MNGATEFHSPVVKNEVLTLFQECIYFPWWE